MNAFRLLGRHHCCQWRILERGVTDGLAEALSPLHAPEYFATGIDGGRVGVDVERVDHLRLQLVQGGGEVCSNAVHVCLFAGEAQGRREGGCS